MTAGNRGMRAGEHLTLSHCFHGHAYASTGRTKAGYCKECHRLSNYVKTEVCPRGHVVSDKGLTDHGKCKACNQEKHLRKKRQEPQYWDKYTPGANLRNRRNSGCLNPTDEIKSGPCEICGVFKKSLCFDHNKRTGLFRGWLCRTCNFGIGYAREDVRVLNRAIGYLSLHNTSTLAA